MMIEDEDLRSLYQVTSAGRIEALAAGLLVPEFSLNADQLETLRREAHSLKGDARVMGLDAIAGLAQQLEAALKSVQQGEIDPATSWHASLTDCFAQTLQTIDQLVAAATTGQSADIDVQAMSDRLKESLAAVTVSSDAQTSQSGQASQKKQASQNGQSGPESADTADAAAEANEQTGFIADADMRSLYRTLSERRIQAIALALEKLTSETDLSQSLIEFRHEVHGLKGDSLAVAVNPVAQIMAQFEAVANSLATRALSLTPPLHHQLSSGLWLAQQFIAQAVNPAPNTTVTEITATDNNIPSPAVGSTQLTQLLEDLAALTEAESDTAEALSTPPPLIADEELCEIYRTTSERRLQLLEGVLSQLEAEPRNQTAITTMRQEVHSLKGDALAIGAEAIGELSCALETTVRGVENGEMILTPTLGNSLRQSLIAISQLVQTATTGAPNNVHLTQVTQNLLDSAAQAVSAQAISGNLLGGLTDSTVDNSQAIPPAETQPAANTPLTAPALSTYPSAIEDAELREVYRVATAERLERLEQGLVQLERQPTHEMFAEMLREAHSLKGDARSVGLDTIGSLSHAVEDILIGLQAMGSGPTAEVSEALYRGLDAIAQLADEATTGTPNRLSDTGALLRSLREITPAADSTANPIATDLTATNLTTDRPTTDSTGSDALTAITKDPAPWMPAPEPLPAANPALSEAPFRLETIRVQARDLDSLAEQTEQLTLTRIQTMQTTGQVLELAALWEKWQSHQSYQKLQGRPSAPSPEATPNPYEKQLDGLINALRLSAQENSFKLDLISQDLSKQVQTLRLLPVANIFRPFPRLVRDLARQQSKTVELVTEGEDTTADKRILEEIQDAVMHLVRNALDHGIETPEVREKAGKPPTAKLSLRSYQTPTSLIIEVADDGQGLDLEAIKQTALKRKLYSQQDLDALSESQLQDLIFAPGFSTRSFTTELSGRGVGLDVVRNQVERLKGNVQIESVPGQGCTFRIQISTQLTTVNVVFINTRGVTHALPIDYLQTTLRVTPEDIVSEDGRETIVWGDRNIPVVDLFDVLELAHSPAYRPPTERPLTNQRACLILTVGDDIGAFLVDRLLDTQEIVFKTQSKLLKRVRNVSGSTILGNGAICTILNPPDLVKSIQRAGIPLTAPPEEIPRQSVILLVEDSPLVRIQEKRLFENAGYEVITAEDGLEGYKLLRSGAFDAVISDIEMPNLDGLALTTKIREHAEYDELPIILVTTLSSDSDRRRGADAGANAYIVKGKFNQEALLETLHRLI